LHRIFQQFSYQGDINIIKMFIFISYSSFSVEKRCSFAFFSFIKILYMTNKPVLDVIWKLIFNFLHHYKNSFSLFYHRKSRCGKKFHQNFRSMIRRHSKDLYKFYCYNVQRVGVSTFKVFKLEVIVVLNTNFSDSSHWMKVP